MVKQRSRVAAKDISFKYAQKNVLENISFSVAPGEIFALFGPNSSGKTTLLHCLSGKLKPASGIIKMDGQELRKLPTMERARTVAVVHQINQPTFPYSAEMLVLMGRTPHMGFFAVPGSRERAAAARALEDMEIGHLAKRPVNQLSGGERQMVLIARALAQDTRVLLLDEPTTYLDFRNQTQVLQCIRHLVQKRDLSVIITLHDPNLVHQYAHRVLLLNEGRIAGLGSPKEELTAAVLEQIYNLPVETVCSGSRLFLVPKQDFTTLDRIY